MTMRVTITFDRRADVSEPNRSDFVDVCLVDHERRTASWIGRTISFLTERDVVLVLENLTDENFVLEEFERIEFTTA